MRTEQRPKTRGGEPNLVRCLPVTRGVDFDEDKEDNNDDNDKDTNDGQGGSLGSRGGSPTWLDAFLVGKGVDNYA